jgi:hypothetical protein
MQHLRCMAGPSNVHTASAIPLQRGTAAAAGPQDHPMCSKAMLQNAHTEASVLQIRCKAVLQRLPPSDGTEISPNVHSHVAFAIHVRKVIVPLDYLQRLSICDKASQKYVRKLGVVRQAPRKQHWKRMSYSHALR